MNKHKLPTELLEKDFFILSIFFWGYGVDGRRGTKLMSVAATKTRKHHYFKSKIDGDGAEITHDNLAQFEAYLTEQGAEILDYES